MAISLFKYHCALREDGTLVSTCGEFSEDLFEQIFDATGNEPAVFPFMFIFITVNNSMIMLMIKTRCRNVFENVCLI